MFRSQTKKAVERDRLDEERWIRDIRDCVRHMVPRIDSAKGDIKVPTLRLH